MKSRANKKVPVDAKLLTLPANAGRAIVKNEAIIACPLRRIESRPIIKVLERVARLAARNPLPTMYETWEKNQASKYLGKKRNPDRK